MLDFSILTNNMDLYLEGFKYTIIASLIALVASFVLGTIIAVMRIAPLKIVNVIGTVYVEFIRNIPLVVIVFLFYRGGNQRYSGRSAGTNYLYGSFYRRSYTSRNYGGSKRAT